MHLTEKSLITNKHTQGWGKNKDEYKSTHKNKKHKYSLAISIYITEVVALNT